LKIFPPSQDFFAGAFAIVQAHQSEARQNVNSNAGAKPSGESLQKLKHLSRFDLELYRFASELFEQHATACLTA
jgi:hypothetical protein